MNAGFSSWFHENQLWGETVSVTSFILSLSIWKVLDSGIVSVLLGWLFIDNGLKTLYL